MSPLYSLPLEGATPGGGDYLFCYLQMLSPSPQPPPLKGGGVLGPRDIKDIPETRYWGAGGGAGAGDTCAAGESRVHLGPVFFLLEVNQPASLALHWAKHLSGCQWQPCQCETRSDFSVAFLENIIYIDLIKRLYELPIRSHDLYEWSIKMLASLFGSISAERALIFLFARGEGYAREIAKFYNTNLTPIQRGLERFEANGILSSRLAGKTRLYSFNPRYPFKPEIENLLKKALTFYSPNERETLLMNRRRPRRSGKPL